MTDDRQIGDALRAAEDGLAAGQPPGPHWSGAVRRGIAARRRRRRLAAAGLASLLVLGGTGVVYGVTGTDRGDNLIAVSPTESASADPTPSPTALPSAAPSEAPRPTAPPPVAACVPAFAANTLRDTGSPSGTQLGLRSATAALQDDYDRVVFALGGDGGGAPGWAVEYVDDPRSDGPGEPVAVRGAATLKVVIENVGTPGDTGVAYPTDRRFSPRDTEVVEEVVVDSLFEGYSTTFIGTSARLPFRVFKLNDPVRLVVDVRHC